ncbi:MAG TPA: 2,3-bisphosphoglycerate-dependent phosphoglycerate mutase [Ignavibacteria bacterium]|nr:2,3-bisphosphoglycerate-dependent phosphoglycerate mutase [Ignavibacteria bacterium]
MPDLVIVRHGQSLWNLENKFTGWIDVDLSDKGIDEAVNAAESLKNYKFDVAFSSVLKRANRTLDIILENTNQKNIPVTKDEALNERMYGDLQGLNKDETREKFGDEQVKIWRRSFDVPPPNGESLKDTADRVLPYYHKVIEPELKAGKNVIISAHGNSLRALMMYLENLTKEQILETEIPTGKPILYKLDENLKVKEKIFL